MATVNNNTPTLRFPEFKGNWTNKKLGEITSWASGGTPPKDNALFWDGDIPWISASSMRGIVYSDSELKITNAGLKKGSKLAKKGSLLILVRGSMLFNKIPIGIVSKDVAFNQDVKSIVVDNHSTSEFILNWFTAFEPMILNMVTGTGIGAGKLDLPDLKALEIQIPTLPEQQKIATFLTAVDEKLQALKQKKSLLEQYKKGVMQKIFSQELRFKDDNGNEYSDWEEKKLGDVCEMKNGYAFKSNSYSVNGKYNIVTISNVQNGYLDIKKINKIEDVPNECLKHQILEIGDLLISLTGNVGRVCFVSELNCLLNQRVGKLIPKNISKLFLFQLLRLEAFITQMIADSQGGAQLNLSKPDIERYEIYLPSMSEQIKIATFLSTIDEKINHCQAQITNTEVWKKGLLQGMFV